MRGLNNKEVINNTEFLEVRKLFGNIDYDEIYYIN